MKTEAPMIPLGELIEECDKRNSDNTLTLDNVRGISIEKKFIPTKANMSGVPLTSYKIVRSHWFCYVPVTSRNGDRISLAIYEEAAPAIVSSTYSVFRSKDEEVLLPEYLYLMFKRAEFDRYARFNSWGSARETFDFSEMCRAEIPLPDIGVQRDLVAIYEGVQKIIAENEELIAQLETVCHDFIVDCKDKYPKVKLGDWIEEYDERNSDNQNKNVRSVSVSKEFKETNAKVNKDELRGYKLVPPFHIAYVQTTKNEKCFANALNISSETLVVSSVDKVITTKDPSRMNIGFVHLVFRNKEFDRDAIFNSWGSAREVFSYEELCDVMIPFPDIEIQKAIVDVYCCLDEAKCIVAEALELMKNICPALVQKAAHSA